MVCRPPVVQHAFTAFGQSPRTIDKQLCLQSATGQAGEAEEFKERQFDFALTICDQVEHTFAIARGCQDPPSLDTGRWPLGLELIIKAFRTANEQRLLRLMVDIVETTGPTFEQKLLGFRGIDTVEPVNIEAVLSKQFTGLCGLHWSLGHVAEL